MGKSKVESLPKDLRAIHKDMLSVKFPKPKKQSFNGKRYDHIFYDEYSNLEWRHANASELFTTVTSVESAPLTIEAMEEAIDSIKYMQHDPWLVVPPSLYDQLKKEEEKERIEQDNQARLQEFMNIMADQQMLKMMPLYHVANDTSVGMVAGIDVAAGDSITVKIDLNGAIISEN